MCNSRLCLTECRLSIRFSAPNYLATPAGILALLQRPQGSSHLSPCPHQAGTRSFSSRASRHQSPVTNAKSDPTPGQKAKRSGRRERRKRRKEGGLAKDKRERLRDRDKVPEVGSCSVRFPITIRTVADGTSSRSHRVSKLTLPVFRLRFPSGETRVRTLSLVGPVRL